ncbi:GNAT family N-acetyltransferase [Dehalogenimonas sp. THU2]|uniref:GNAT family N-acetyltransferase n=1 Tax=Dehalogenimonas sp. THU2 TaxID=3151121 RepID=UPI0032184C13
MPNSLAIRPFAEDDLPDLLRLIHNTVERSYGLHYTPAVIQLFIKFHSAENIRKDAAAGDIVIGWIDNEPVSTGSLIGGYVSRVFVRPEYQGKGYGRSIAVELERLAAGRGIESLELDAAIGSRHFWQSLGYEVKSHEVELVEGEPLEYYKMTKRLENSTR